MGISSFSSSCLYPLVLFLELNMFPKFLTKEEKYKIVQRRRAKILYPRTKTNLQKRRDEERTKRIIEIFEGKYANDRVE